MSCDFISNLVPQYQQMIRILYIVMNLFSIRHCSPSELLTAQHRPCHPGELLPTASSHQLPAPTRLPFIFQTHHGASFPQAPATPSSLPSIPPTPPLPFRAPLRPVSSWNEASVPLPPTLSSPFPTFPTLLPSAPSSYTFLPSLQGLPTATPNTAPMPPPTPRRNPSHALHPPVPVQTSPWLSSPLLRYICIYAPACILLNTFEEAWWDANMCAERPCTPMLHTINYKGRFEEPWCRVC